MLDARSTRSDKKYIIDNFAFFDTIENNSQTILILIYIRLIEFQINFIQLLKKLSLDVLSFELY